MSAGRAVLLVAALAAAVMWSSPAFGARIMSDAAAVTRGAAAEVAGQQMAAKNLGQQQLRRSLAVTNETGLQLAARLVDSLSFDLINATLTCPGGNPVVASLLLGNY